MDDTVA